MEKSRGGDGGGDGGGGVLDQDGLAWAGGWL